MALNGMQSQFVGYLTACYNSLPQDPMIAMGRYIKRISRWRTQGNCDREIDFPSERLSNDSLVLHPCSAENLEDLYRAYYAVLL